MVFSLVEAPRDVPTRSTPFAGNDTITGTAFDDVVTSGDGNGTVTGLAGDDVLTGGDGNNIITGGLGDDFRDGGPGITPARRSGRWRSGRPQ